MSTPPPQVTGDVPVCPHCAHGDELPLDCSRCGWTWYDNPRPTAGAIVERPGDEPSILLLRRAVPPEAGRWDLPAGYLGPRESPEQGALRETLEETGLEVELLRIVGVYTSRATNAISTVFVARPRDPAAPVRRDHESSEAIWVPRADVAAWLPRMAFPAMARAIEDWAAGRLGLPQAVPARRPARGAGPHQQ